MFYYLDFYAGPTDQIIRFIYAVESQRRGWASLQYVAQQNEGSPLRYIENEGLIKARVMRMRSGVRSYTIPGGVFGSPGWWMDLTPSDDFPALPAVPAEEAVANGEAQGL
jgi:hypothetical protein